ncbi:HAD family hydrolase, partial [Promineifilum sp.]|uniref:HAD family hydrolase n=1 Tax=Promineifilum sp. TaxID=2664178 RepID=UPI0035AFF378
MSNIIRAVIFDVGGVLVRTRDHAGRQAWEARLGLGAGEAEAIVLNSEMGRRAQRGELTTAALWAWVAERLGLGDDLDAFRRDFWRGDAVDEALVGLIRRLRPRYQLAIISNASDSLLPTLSEYGLAEKFDLIVGSAAEGVMKPQPEIYRRALARLGRAPQEAVFIDDAPANVAGARAVGMAAIHFTPGIDLEGELGRLG